MSIKGDFISFTYNGIHSTELGIVHVSSSDRYNDNLLPTFKDKTIEIPGAHGTYYFGSYYSNRTIDLNVAFDEVTEDGIRLMRQMFIDKKPHELIFDEEPYKVYYAIAKTPNISFIPFQNYDDELLNGTPRIYKGEGTFNFICCEPFAHCPWNRKYLYPQWNAEAHVPAWYKYENKDEWNLSAHLLSTWNGFDNHTGLGPLITRLYNPGDVPTDFQLIIPFNSCKKIQYIRLHEDNIGYIKQLEINFDNLKIKSSYGSNESVHVCFDSKTELLQEWIRNDSIENEHDSYRNTGKIYNEALQSTEWFKIPNMNTICIDNSWQPIEDWYLDIILKDGESWNEPRPTLWYEYLYY